MWFISLGEGVYKLPSREFRNIQLNTNGNSSPISSLKKSSNTLYIGGDHFTVWSYNTTNQTTQRHTIKKGDSQGRITVLDTLLNSLFVGTDYGAYLWTNHGFRSFHINTAIKAAYIKNRKIYLCTKLGIFPADPISMTYKDTSVFDYRTTAICIKGDTLFAGSLNGLYAKRLDRIYTPFPGRFLGNDYEMLKTRITGIAEDHKGILWIATYGKGVAGYSNGRIIHVIDEQKGLTSNICRTLHLANDALWIGTDKGLNKVQFTGDSFSITRFTWADGLPSEIINAIAVDKDTVYIGTPVGLTCFIESRVFTNSMCRLKMIAVRSDKKQWIAGFNKVQFDHYDNNLRFEYAGISFKSAGEINYRYRVLGLEDNWRATRDNFLAFPTLPSGEYELQIQATNKFGVQSDIVSVKFEVTRLLWEKTWFRITALLLLVIAIWLFIRWRIQRIRYQEELKSVTNSRMAELEQMALKAQMNPHFIFNSLNSIQQFVFSKDVQGANRFLTEFSKLIRMTLDISSRTKISIEEEVKYLSIYLQLEKRRFDNNFTFHIRVANEKLYEAYIPPMILQPYIENAIRHGVRYRDDNRGVITVAFYEEDGYLVCMVEDNGIGRTASKQMKGKLSIEYQSKGMTLTEKRIEMMNKRTDIPIHISIEDLYNDHQQALGTRVMIRFPLHETKEPAEI